MTEDEDVTEITLYARWTVKRYMVTISKPDDVSVTGVVSGEQYTGGEAIRFSVTSTDSEASIRVYANGTKLADDEGTYSFTILSSSATRVMVIKDWIICGSSPSRHRAKTGELLQMVSAKDLEALMANLKAGLCRSG